MTGPERNRLARRFKKSADGTGPWFTAEYETEASCCDRVEPGEEIRADGHGGWEHRDCVGEE